MVFPGRPWWTEIYELPHWLWEQMNEVAEQRMKGG